MENGKKEGELEFQHMKSITSDNRIKNKSEMNQNVTETIWNDSEDENFGQADQNDEDQAEVMKYQQPFKTISELIVVWAAGPEGEIKKAYDGFASFCLEITY